MRVSSRFFNSRALVTLALLLSLCALVSSVEGQGAAVGHRGSAGDRSLFGDFETYWIMTNYWLERGVPYDFPAVTRYAASRGLTLTGPAFFPPWALPVFSPLMMLPFGLASAVWFVLSICLLVHSVKIIVAMSPYAGRRLRPLQMGALLLAPGALLCLSFGQFGILCLWGLVMGQRLLRTSPALLPAVTLLATVKPHLAYLYWIGLAVQLVKECRFGLLVACPGVAVLATALVELWAPGSLSAWLNGTNGALTWKGASVVTVVRTIFASAADPAPAWPIWLSIGAALLVAVTVIVRSEGASRLGEPFLVALSVCSIPYVWSLDFPVLFVAEVPLLLRTFFRGTGKARDLAAMLVWCARGGLFLQGVFGTVDHRTWWYPPVILLAWVIGARAREVTSR